MKKKKKNNKSIFILLLFLAVGILLLLLNIDRVFDNRSDAAAKKVNTTVKQGKVRSPTKVPVRVPTKKTNRPSSDPVVGGCCSDADCNSSCASPSCMIYKCKNAILCKSGGNGSGSCVKR